MFQTSYIALVLILLNTLCKGSERTTFNPNAANVDFIISESGRVPQSTLGLSASPQESQNNNERKPGRVRDLIVFYNSPGNVTNVPSKRSNFSSVTAGSKTQVPATPTDSRSILTPSSKSHKDTDVSKPSAKHNAFQHRGHLETSQNHGIVNSSAPLPSQRPSTSVKPSSKPTFSEILGGRGQTLNEHTPGSTQRSPMTSTPISSAVYGRSSSYTSTTCQKPLSPSPRLTTGRVFPTALLSNQGKPSGGVASDSELQALSEELFRKDTNNVAKLITVNYQEKTTSQSKEDKAPLPLFNIPDSVYRVSTIEKFMPLLDNYERDTLINEYVTPQERNEENSFMDAIMQTQVIRHLMTFLKDRGYVTPDPRQQRDFLKQMWFNLYSRGKGKISSSGFEHVFVSEMKNGEVSGLHNWLYFAQEEAASRANYLGFLRYTELNGKGAVLKFHFNQQNVDKPVDTMFVGTSPELEIALYSICFIARADRDCPLKLGGKNINIVTHTLRYRSKNMIGSAYPQI